MSRRRIRSGVFVAAAELAILTASLPARAGLGGDVTSIQADQVQMQGTRRELAQESYTVHEIQAGSGTVVREYVSSEGKVFAVAFHGPWLPDMRQLLGSYFDQYSRAVQNSRAMEAQSGARRARHPVVVEEPGLSLQIVGHPRAFAGRAYVPGMLPAGVKAEDIQ